MRIILTHNSKITYIFLNGSDALESNQITSAYEAEKIPYLPPAIYI